MKTVVEILQDAKTVLMERGRHKGAMRNPDGPEVCLIGAIQVAGGIPRGAAEWQRYEETMGLLKCQVGAIAPFNDHPDITDGDVFAVLDNAILAAKELE